MFVPFHPQPPNDSLPEVFPTPFRPGAPHPLAARAAEALQARLQSEPAFTDAMFHGSLGGKMFGVLAVRHPDGRVGYLQGFAGMLGERRLVAGFVPPTYDVERFEALWQGGGVEIAAYDARLAELRPRLEDDPAAREQFQAITAAQQAFSRSLHAKIYETYSIPNARGERAKLLSLFEPRPPPGGSGDCAGPKLLAQAFAMDLHPVALGEFWWGGSPPAGGRQHGVYYPACRGRCAKILPFMLDGLPCEPAPDVGLGVIPEACPDVLYEDKHILVVDKPVALLSVPGRGPRRRDSVEHRLQQRRCPDEPSWPRLVHRLDLATSGLLIAAKAKPAYVALQRQFSARTVDKRYVALVRGQLSADAGVVELALARDLDDRPRQMHDPVLGKAAVTRWEVLERDPVADTTRVALYPKTGRTHQLRLHASHPQGLDAPIVGDLLYGYGGERLMLHAEGITFVHPATGEVLTLRSPCPF